MRCSLSWSWRGRLQVVAERARNFRPKSSGWNHPDDGGRVACDAREQPTIYSGIESKDAVGGLGSLTRAGSFPGAASGAPSERWTSIVRIRLR
jgi:hypothetical protein